MIRKHKKFERPKKAFESDRIKEENTLVKRYGLKNKKEVWKADSKIKYFRGRAKSLITADKEMQDKFITKLNAIGLKVNNVVEILSLNKEDLLKRRLSTIVSDKSLADTAKQARQMIVHKRIIVDGRVMNVPSYIVKISEEDSITLKKNVKKPKPAPVEEKTEDVEGDIAEEKPVDAEQPESGATEEAEKKEEVKEDAK